MAGTQEHRKLACTFHSLGCVCVDIFLVCIELAWLPSLVIDPGSAPPFLSFVELHLPFDGGTIISGLLSEGTWACLREQSLERPMERSTYLLRPVALVKKLLAVERHFQLNVTPKVR